ncbi:enoyl-CoA hydratase-related protein [Kibdelosporangium lantanae]
MSVEVAVQGGVAHVRLNRGDQGNAIDLTLATALLDAARRCQADDVRAVLLTAAGRAFCVGGDLREFAAVADLRAHLVQVTDALHDALRILTTIDAPVVVAVHGAVAGAGLGLIGAADLAIASEDATFVAAYTGIGYSPDAGVSWSLPRLVGPATALDLLLTNRRLTAGEARAAGLVAQVVADAEATATDLASWLAGGPTGAFGATKRLVRLSTSFDAQLDAEAEALADAAVSPDGREGVRAFLANRPPR